MSEYDRLRNKTCKEDGICTTCHAKFAVLGKCTCPICLKNARVRRAEAEGRKIRGQMNLRMRWSMRKSLGHD